jgi:hypothetical protein
LRKPLQPLTLLRIQLNTHRHPHNIIRFIEQFLFYINYGGVH